MDISSFFDSNPHIELHYLRTLDLLQFATSQWRKPASSDFNRGMQYLTPHRLTKEQVEAIIDHGFAPVRARLGSDYAVLKSEIVAALVQGDGMALTNFSDDSIAPKLPTRSGILSKREVVWQEGNRVPVGDVAALAVSFDKFTRHLAQAQSSVLARIG